MKPNHVFWLTILVIVIIVVVPWLFTQKYFTLGDYSSTGQIGDTIGGLASPFINGLAAILVFVTFREQVNANKELKAQNTNLEKQILDEHTRVDYDRIVSALTTMQRYEFRVGSSLVDLQTIISIVENREGALNVQSVDDSNVVKSLQTVRLILGEFDLIRRLMDRFPNNPDKSVLANRFRLIYNFQYLDDLSRLELFLSRFKNTRNVQFNVAIEEIIRRNQELLRYSISLRDLAGE